MQEPIYGIQGKTHKNCLITHSRANLALTLTKLVLRTKDLIFMLFDGLEVFLGVCGMSSNSGKLKMAGVRRIYRPPSLVAVAPTVSRTPVGAALRALLRLSSLFFVIT